MVKTTDLLPKASSVSRKMGKRLVELKIPSPGMIVPAGYLARIRCGYFWIGEITQIHGELWSREKIAGVRVAWYSLKVKAMIKEEISNGVFFEHAHAGFSFPLKNLLQIDNKATQRDMWHHRDTRVVHHHHRNHSARRKRIWVSQSTFLVFQ